MFITLYGGAGEIGGNKILLEDRDTKIFLDFGMNFSQHQKFYSEFLQPRVSNGLGDMLEFGIIPDIKGVYRDDMLHNEGRELTVKPAIDGVFISHAHADHSWHVSLLHKDMPIHCGVTTELILKATQESSVMPYYGDFYYYKENFVDRRSKPKHSRPYKPFRTGGKIKIGGMEIEPVHVDHSIPGAYGFIVHTSAGAIIYTGDLRTHGTKPEMTKDFIEKAAEAKPVAMLCEGTRIGDKERGLSESEVFEKVKQLASKTTRLVIANYPPKDIDRFNTFFKAAQATGRKLAVPFKHAYMLKLLKEQDANLNVPFLNDENLAIYAHKAWWGKHVREDYSYWEQQFLGYPNMVTCEDIKKNQGRFIFFCDYFDLKELIDIKPDSGSVYVYSLSEPHDEEQEFDFARMQNWLRHFSLPIFQAHASGHASQREIAGMVNSIKPKIIIPVHTALPEMFPKLFPDFKIAIPEYAKRIAIE